MQIVLITGISGSGKSVALNALEDKGYYCVDNLPPNLLFALALELTQSKVQHLAVSIDARSAASLINLPDIVTQLKNEHSVRVLFLNASNEALLRRFSETRRTHPLSKIANNNVLKVSLTSAIDNERQLLNGLNELDIQIDTSTFTANTLRAYIKTFTDQREENNLILVFQSFGFKNGLPLDADFVFDLRTLPNPYYESHLRALTGLDEEVKNFFQTIPEVKVMAEDIYEFIKKRLSQFAAEGRSYLTIALGCTGGQHRSVYLVEKLASYFKNDNLHSIILHRDIEQKTKSII